MATRMIQSRVVNSCKQPYEMIHELPVPLNDTGRKICIADIAESPLITATFTYNAGCTTDPGSMYTFLPSEKAIMPELVN